MLWWHKHSGICGQGAALLLWATPNQGHPNAKPPSVNLFLVSILLSSRNGHLSTPKQLKRTHLQGRMKPTLAHRKQSFSHGGAVHKRVTMYVRTWYMAKKPVKRGTNHRPNKSLLPDSVQLIYQSPVSFVQHISCCLHLMFLNCSITLLQT